MATLPGSHPFRSRERVNFPEFSPIFSRHVTPESSQRGFHWSIDHIARMKPADIDTDPFTLVKTNGQSPESDEETQQASERFFSQHSILPSPWPTGRPKSSIRSTPTVSMTSHLHPHSSITPSHTKKVTFSPHPPAMAYISSESIDSEPRDTVDAETQTALSIPLACNLGELLGPAYVYSGGDESISGVRDLGNSSLRRKLFGQPERLIEEGGEGMEGGGGEMKGGGVGGDMQSTTAYVTPSMCLPTDCHLSSTPLNSHTSHNHQYSSHTPCHYSPSPPILHARMGKASNTKPITSSFVLSPGGNLPEFSPIKEASEEAVVNAPRSDSEACKQLFSTTPRKQSIHSTHLTPSPLPTCPPFSPILSHHPHSDCVRSGCDGGRSASGEQMTPTSVATQNRASSASKPTSTPYQHESHCTPNHGETGKEEDVVKQNGGREQEVGSWYRGEGVEGEKEDDGSESSEGLPQPLSLADLQTVTYDDDLTSITGVTTCTSYLTQLVTDTTDSHMVNERQPLHSTVAIPNSTWNPLTSLEPHQGAPLTDDNTAAPYRLPSITEISRINAPSMNVTDSGVAASSYFNQPTGGSLTQLTHSGGIGVLNSTNIAPTANQENEKPQENQQIGCDCRKSVSRVVDHQSGVLRTEVDSGLVASPDPEQGVGGEGDVRHIGQAVPRQPLDVLSKSPGKFHSTIPPRTATITPSRYSGITLYRNRLGVPLAVTQKSIYLHGNVLPSQLKLASALPFPFSNTSPSLSSRARSCHTPSRQTSSSNWLGRSLTSQKGLSPSPIFPHEVIKKKETLKTRLQFYSPVYSRSPVRRPFIDTLNFPSPVSSHPFTNLPLSPLPSSHPPSPSLLPPCAFSPSYNHFPSSPSLSSLNVLHRH